ncbi:hypothetical protein, partial [Pseudomonas aeruginosa]|uniref:hypothetical protein n=1 Tax=Pseudomonas aeruginosa TaxID=287 RepID=UPI001F327DB4
AYILGTNFHLTIYPFGQNDHNMIHTEPFPLADAEYQNKYSSFTPSVKLGQHTRPTQQLYPTNLDYPANYKILQK